MDDFYGLLYLAERVGFEPTVPKRHNGFRNRHNRPLCHLSLNISRISTFLIILCYLSSKKIDSFDIHLILRLRKISQYLLFD